MKTPLTQTPLTKPLLSNPLLIKPLLIALLVSLPGVCAAQAVDVVGVRDNFIVAGLAAQKCNIGNREKKDLHERNFTIVSRKAMEQITARTPGTDPDEARRKDLAHIERLQDATFNLLRTEGCNSDKVRALLRMHRMHETIRF